MIIKAILLALCLYVLYRLVRRPFARGNSDIHGKFTDGNDAPGDEKDITARGRVVEEKSE